MELGGRPTAALAVEVVGAAGLLVEHEDVVEVVDVDVLAYEQGLKLLVLPGGIGLDDVVLEPVELEYHARA